MQHVLGQSLLESNVDIFQEGEMYHQNESRSSLACSAALVNPTGATCVFATPMITPQPARDYWERRGRTLVRHHVCPRTKLFTFGSTAMPLGVDRHNIAAHRRTNIKFVMSGTEMAIEDRHCDEMSANRSMKTKWTGTTEFTLNGLH